MKIRFDPSEKRVAYTKPAYYTGPIVPVYSYPVTPKEGVRAALSREPLWQVVGIEEDMFIPRANPDNLARSFVLDGSEHEQGFNGDGLDMFGVKWEYVEQAGGCMVRPGNPLLNDANEWKDKLVWPDVDSWGWEETARTAKIFLKRDTAISCWFLNGWFERLLSFMHTEDALMALVDEDQKDAIKGMFEKLSDLYIKIIDKYVEYFPEIDLFFVHDDWGSQKSPFFSPEVGAEMFVPYMRKVTDHIHSKGKFCELHSCGNIFKQIGNVCDAGWDTWSGQLMNDTQALYEMYGDRIMMQVTPDLFDPERLTLEEQRAKAREYCDRFCNPDKPSMFNGYGNQVMTDAYREKLYVRSRINYCGSI